MNKVKEYPWLYVTEDATVISKARGKDKILSQGSDKDGYKTIGTRKDGRCYCLRVHRLVALTFIPNPENKPFVNHKDGVKFNNLVENLEWVTAKENTVHAYDNNLIKILRGSATSSSKYSEDTIHLLCKLLQDGLTNKEIYAQLSEGISYSLIKDVRGGKSWGHLSCLYTFRSKSGRGSIKESLVEEVCESLQKGSPVKSITLALGVTESVVYPIKQRNSYKHITEKYSF